MTLDDADDARHGIQSVEVAMAVLRTLEEGLGPMSLTQIAAASGMGPSKVHRYLVSLGRAGLVAQLRRSGLYDLGPVLRRMGIESLRRMDEVGLASAQLPGLRDRTGHAVNLAVWGDRGPVIVRWDYGNYALPMTVRIGATLPLLTSAVGQVYLAYLADTLTEPIVSAERGQEADLSPTAEIAAIRAAVLREGVATTLGGVIPGVCSVAAPVFTAVESLPLAVAIAIPMARASEDVVVAATAELLATSAAMSTELGHLAARRA